VPATAALARLPAMPQCGEWAGIAMCSVATAYIRC
jgi:hypothetical protein